MTNQTMKNEEEVIETSHVKTVIPVAVEVSVSICHGSGVKDDLQLKFM